MLCQARLKRLEMRFPRSKFLLPGRFTSRKISTGSGCFGPLLSRFPSPGLASPSSITPKEAWSSKLLNRSRYVNVLTIHSLTFNVKYMYRWCNDYPDMSGKLKWYLPQAKYKDWDDLALRNGHGVAQDFLYIDQISGPPRHSLATQWIANHPGEPSTYYISMTIPVVPNFPKTATSFIKPEHEVEIVFGPRPVGKLQNGAPIPDVEGWKATFVGDEFPHAGSHLIYVKHKYGDSEREPKVIPAVTSWHPRGPFHKIYLRYTELPPRQ